VRLSACHALETSAIHRRRHLEQIVANDSNGLVPIKRASQLRRLYRPNVLTRSRGSVSARRTLALRLIALSRFCGVFEARIRKIVLLDQPSAISTPRAYAPHRRRCHVPRPKEAFGKFGYIQLRTVSIPAHLLVTMALRQPALLCQERAQFPGRGAAFDAIARW